MTLDFSALSHFSNDKALAFGFMTQREVWLLRTIAHSLDVPPKIVNIGAGAGTSGLAFVESRPDATVWTVDISEGGPLGGLQNERNAFEGTGLKLPYQILDDSKHAGKVWKNGLVDIVCIDGDHSYEGCKGDIEAWISRVSADGWMLFHDYGRDVWPQVVAAVNDTLAPTAFVEVLTVDTLSAWKYINE